MVNASLLESMAAAKTAHDVYGILDGSTAAEVAMDAIEYVWSGDYKVLVISFHDMLSLSFSYSITEFFLFFFIVLPEQS